MSVVRDGKLNQEFRNCAICANCDIFTRCSFQLFVVFLAGYEYAIIGTCSSYEEQNRKNFLEKPLSFNYFR